MDSDPPERIWISWGNRIREYVRADLVPPPAAPAPPAPPPPATVIVSKHDSDPKRIIRVKLAAQKLGVSIPTLYRMVKAGILPKPIKIGNASGWRQEVLDALGEPKPLERPSEAPRKGLRRGSKR